MGYSPCDKDDISAITFMSSVSDIVYIPNKFI